MKIYAETIAHKDTSGIKQTFHKENRPIDLLSITGKITRRREALLMLLYSGLGKTPEKIAPLTLVEKKRLIHSEIKQQTRLALFLKQSVLEFDNGYKPSLLICKNKHKLSASNSSIKTIGRNTHGENKKQAKIISPLDRTIVSKVNEKPP